MAEEWDYGNEWGATYDPWYPETTNAGGVTDYLQSPAYQQFTGWGDPTGVGSSGDTSFSGEGSGWWNTVLGGLGAVGGFLGKNARTLGPLISGAGSIAGGAIGSNAANDAARLQSEALNRGIDLQTAQWLQQQGNLAPYLQAGQQGLSQLQQLAGREQPALPGVNASVQGSQYGLPSPYPGWQPRQFQRPDDVNAGAYQWTPQQGPQAQDYRYTPGNIPSAAANRWTPGQGPSAQDYRYTPGQTPDAANYRYTAGAVPTLSGKELLANDPGVQFRIDEGRKALEGSAAARGDLLSGGNLKALQSRAQDLASQEYGAAWNRASQQAQLREQWGQAESQMGWQQAEAASRLREQVQQYATQQGWSQAQAEAVFREQMAQQSSQQGYGQQLDETRLREQVNQVASQQGWSQAQAEAVFREQMAQQSQSQNWTQALQGQQNAYNQGLGAEQWAQKQQEAYATQLSDRQAQQAQQAYGRDVYSNEQDYARQQALYKQQLGQYLLPWEQASTLAGLGAKATGQYGEQGAYTSRGISDLLAQLGTAQGQGAAGSGLMWNRALTGAANQVPSLLASLNA